MWVSPEEAGPRRANPLGLQGQNAQVFRAQPQNSTCPPCPGQRGALSQSEPISVMASELCEWPSMCVCMRMCAYVWWGGQRNLDFREEENNVVEGGWITKDFCLQLIVSSCKNTRGEAKPGWGLQFLPTPHRPAEWGPAWLWGGGRGDRPRVNI